MSGETVTIHIIGAPVACEDGVKDTWRQVAGWAARQLRHRFGTAVSVHYFDLFDPDCPSIPAEARLPLVLLDGDPISNGNKISLPDICRQLESRGVVRGR